MLCDARFSLQGRYPSVLDLTVFGITNTAVTIHGSAFHAGKGINEDEFIEKKVDQIEEALVDYLNKRYEFYKNLARLRRSSSGPDRKQWKR